MESSFFSMILRMKYINRWGLMRNTWQESLSQHSMDVAVIAHALAVICNRRLGGQVDADRAAVLGLFHDTSEIITGDMPTPAKYHNPEMRAAYRWVEAWAQQDLLDKLPSDLRPDYEPLIFEKADPHLLQIVKAADKISALIKCIEEEKAGNHEFIRAKQAQLTALQEMDLPEANIFLQEFTGSFEKTLDEL